MVAQYAPPLPEARKRSTVAGRASLEGCPPADEEGNASGEVLRGCWSGCAPSLSTSMLFDMVRHCARVAVAATGEIGREGETRLRGWKSAPRREQLTKL